MTIKNCSFRRLLLTNLLFCQLSFAQEAPTVADALQNFGINGAQMAQLERGEIVSYEVSETSQKELAIGVAMILPVNLSQIVNYIKKGRLSSIENDITANGTLPVNANINSLKKLGFSDKQADEAQDFLEAEAGDEFNLSTQELETLKTLRENETVLNNKTVVNIANQTYRQFLLQRLQSYQKSGLAGISAYSRGKEQANPAAELRTDAMNSKAWAQYFPALQQAWLNYPNGMPENATEQFVWLNRNVENRPTPILNHRILVTSEKGGIVLSRQFYVGHSYNSSSVVAGGLPYKDGTLVFYSTRSSTDQVAGMGSGLKHSIGREQMKKEMIKLLQRLNKDLKRQPAEVAEES